MKLDRTDSIVLITGGTALVILSFLLFYLLSDSHKLAGKKEVGKITFRYKEAQRKPSSSVIWIDVEQNDIVYGMDSIRTDNLSEAIIHLNDGANIEMDPDSMIVLEINESGSSLNILNGSVLIKNATKPVSVKVGNVLIPGAKEEIRIYKSPNDTIIQATSGFDYIFKNERKKAEKSIISINGETETSYRPTSDLIAPPDNSRYFIPGNLSEITFQWQSEKPAILEISNNLFFNKMILSKQMTTNTFTTMLGEGIYFWRIRNNSGFSASKKFRIIRLPEITLQTPLNDLVLSSGSNVLFSWKKNSLVRKYTTIVATDQDFKNIVKQQESFHNRAVLNLTPGDYFWKVMAEGILPQSNSTSTVGHFSIHQVENIKKETAPLPVSTLEKSNTSELKPILLYPTKNVVVDMSKNDFILFRWQGEPGAEGFVFRLYHSNGTLIKQQKISANSLKFTDLSQLDIGTFRWEIEKAPSNKSEAFFKIILSQELETPELNVK